jgi:hypothetical protein
VPTIPIKRSRVMTTVSPNVWTARDGRIKAPLLLPPSIIAFTMPEARAKNTTR